MLQDPEPEHGRADAEHDDEIGEARHELGGPPDVRNSLDEQRGGHERDPGAEELSAVQDDRVRP